MENNVVENKDGVLETIRMKKKERRKNSVGTCHPCDLGCLVIYIIIPMSIRYVTRP